MGKKDTANRSCEGPTMPKFEGMRLKPIPFLILLFLPIPAFLHSAPLHSPTWGFRLDLPPGYVYVDGNAFDRFSFTGPSESMFDVAVYAGTYGDVGAMMADVNRRLGNSGEVALFEYGGRTAALMELGFGGFEGLALGLELGGDGGPSSAPLLLALAYAPAGTENVDLLHGSVLNSIAPTFADTRRPGPIMEFAFPRGEPVRVPLAGGPGLHATIRENDAEAAQWLVDNEFLVLALYQFSDHWEEAWIRFYRAIYRDSADRISDAAFRIERGLMEEVVAAGHAPGGGERAFAGMALSLVQGFLYERDFDGSDFVNLVSAVTEGRGDCDSRAMLLAVILAQANIPSAIMVSRHYSHAMGLTDVPGPGARFESGGVRWLVAETTANVDIGLIAQDKSDVGHWLGVLFE